MHLKGSRKVTSILSLPTSRMNGLEPLNHIKADAQLEDIPVLFLTAEAEMNILFGLFRRTQRITSLNLLVLRF